MPSLGPGFDVAGVLRQGQNDLVVKIDPAPCEKGTDFPNSFFAGMNVGWTRTAVFNNVYSWHYCNIPSLGIWRSVCVEGAPAVRVEDPFVATRDAEKGEMSIALTLRGGDKPWAGTLAGTITPDSFDGSSLRFEHAVRGDGGARPLHLRFRIPDLKLWWPNDLGEHNLYRLKLSFVPAGDGVPDTRTTTFGIRTVEMAPLPGGPHPDGPWTIDRSVVVPPERCEKSSLYDEPTNRTWFLFTNHIGDGYTDAIWVYWTKDLSKWDSKHKAVMLDGATCSWSKTIVGLPSVLRVGGRLAMFYDGSKDPNDKWHVKRDVGLAWINLPIRLPVD